MSHALGICGTCKKYDCLGPCGNYPCDDCKKYYEECDENECTIVYGVEECIYYEEDRWWENND